MVPKLVERDADLAHKGYRWNWRRYHKWDERSGARYPFLVDAEPIVTRDTRAFCIGSCFADRVAEYLAQTLRLPATSFGHSRQYDTSSTLQTIRHLLVEPQYSWDDMFRTDEGLYAHPFRNQRYRTKTLQELQAWATEIEDEARVGLRNANLVVITLGGTETWRHPVTKKTYLTMPLPDVFNSQMPEIAEFHNLSFAENFDNLEQIYLTLREHVPQAEVLITVSPVRMTFTVTGKDVAVATSQAKSILRSAVGELADRHTDHLHYFHSYEIVAYAPPHARYFMPDDIHVSEEGVAAVMHEFGRCFVSANVRGSEWAFRDALLDNPAAVAAIHTTQPYAVARSLRRVAVRLLRTVGLDGPARAMYRRLA
jgi:hypothetical protein